MTAVPVVRGRGPVALACLVLTLVAALALLGLWSLSRGDPGLSLAAALDVLGGDGDRLTRLTVTQVRLPRFVLGVLVGALLAVAGTLLQDGLRNGLAGPELLGVSAGASVVVAGIVVLGIAVPFAAYPWLALVGAGGSGALVVGATRRSSDPVRVILIGAALSALLSAVVVTLATLGGENAVSLIYAYLLGDLSSRTWEHVRIVAPYAALAVPLAALAVRPLNLLALGDDVAAGLGLHVVRARALLLSFAAMLVAAVVAVCGPVPWVALFTPHLARRALGTGDVRRVLPTAALMGAVLLPAADLLARRAAAPLELPVGVWLTVLGAPFLLVLLRRRAEASPR